MSLNWSMVWKHVKETFILWQTQTEKENCQTLFLSLLNCKCSKYSGKLDCKSFSSKWPRWNKTWCNHQTHLRLKRNFNIKLCVMTILCIIGGVWGLGDLGMFYNGFHGKGLEKLGKPLLHLWCSCLFLNTLLNYKM